MPRGKRETRFYVVEEPTRKNQMKPTVTVFESTPKFKAWVNKTKVTITKQTPQVMWLGFPDGRWALCFKGYSLACVDGRVLV